MKEEVATVKGEASLSCRRKLEAKLRVLLIVARGEAVRNFLYSRTLRVLSENAEVTLLSVVDDEGFLSRFRPHVKQIIPLAPQPENPLLKRFRYLIHAAHYRWLWSEVAKDMWRYRDAQAVRPGARAKWMLWKAAAYLLAHRPVLEVLTRVEQYAAWKLRPNDDFGLLFEKVKPDIVFNCSHIHGVAGELPIRVAKGMGIPTAGFIFSWDNLTSRSRIFEPYDYFLVWHNHMKSQLLGIYPKIEPHRVFVTGTPQFDFHFQPEFLLPREELCRRIGLDSSRPFVLYTTAMDSQFPEEHRMVELVARLLREMTVHPKPQLVVRMYIKGTSREMRRLAQSGLTDVVFPPVLWEERWFTPMLEDVVIYTSLLHHAAVGINATSTVSLELLMHNKPVINLGFDPPGSCLPSYHRYSRTLAFDHYQPVVASGATMVAKSEHEMEEMLIRGLTEPLAFKPAQDKLILEMFQGTADGNAGRRVAETLMQLASINRGSGRPASPQSAVSVVGQRAR